MGGDDLIIIQGNIYIMDGDDLIVIQGNIYIMDGDDLRIIQGNIYNMGGGDLVKLMLELRRLLGSNFFFLYKIFYLFQNIIYDNQRSVDKIMICIFCKIRIFNLF